MTSTHLLTLSGLDKPGITADLICAVSGAGAHLIDIEQVVVQGQLTLCAVVRLDDSARLSPRFLEELKALANKHELDFRARALDAPHVNKANEAARVKYVVTLIGDALCADSLIPITQTLVAFDANIDFIRRLSEDGLLSLEIICSLQEQTRAEPLKRKLVELSDQTGVDIALQRETLTRRAKRLVAFDMDSTLVQIEVIDELARAHGVFEQVANITRSSMEGRKDFEQSLKERVALLEGMPLDVVMRVCVDCPLTHGAEDFVRVLRKLGYKTGVISGGFHFAVDALRKRLDLDFGYSNKLEVKDGKLTGRVLEPIVTPLRKADLLETVAQQEGISLEQTIAVGDGANDIAMIERAGLGIAYHAKPKLRQAADTAIRAGGLDRILYLLGLSERDVRELFERGA